jgi:hypothetical protein
MIKYFFVSCLVLLLSIFIACAGAERGTGQALDNIGSAVQHESKKLWIPAEDPSGRGSIVDGKDKEDVYR